jgi:Arc/MetJ family transcription regulator
MLRGTLPGHTPKIKRTSLNLDFELVEQAREVLHTSGTTDTVRRALEEVIRSNALRALAEWDLGGMTLEDLERMRQPRFAAEESRSALEHLERLDG